MKIKKGDVITSNRIT